MENLLSNLLFESKGLNYLILVVVCLLYIITQVVYSVRYIEGDLGKSDQRVRTTKFVILLVLCIFYFFCGKLSFIDSLIALGGYAVIGFLLSFIFYKLYVNRHYKDIVKKKIDGMDTEQLIRYELDINVYRVESVRTISIIITNWDTFVWVELFSIISKSYDYFSNRCKKIYDYILFRGKLSDIETKIQIKKTELSAEKERLAEQRKNQTNSENI